jgi:hypothetical protein
MSSESGASRTTLFGFVETICRPTCQQIADGKASESVLAFNRTKVCPRMTIGKVCPS